eukprot:8680752-Ditylum_brightwellii.AAC.1
MSGNKQFFFHLKSLLSTTHHGVALADDATNPPVQGIGTMAFKFGPHVVAIHNSLYVPGLADILFSALGSGIQQEC